MSIVSSLAFCQAMISSNFSITTYPILYTFNFRLSTVRLLSTVSVLRFPVSGLQNFFVFFLISPSTRLLIYSQPTPRKTGTSYLRYGFGRQAVGRQFSGPLFLVPDYLSMVSCHSSLVTDQSASELRIHQPPLRVRNRTINFLCSLDPFLDNCI